MYIVSNENVLNQLCFQLDVMIKVLMKLSAEESAKGKFFLSNDPKDILAALDKYPIDNLVYPILDDENKLTNIKAYKAACYLAMTKKGVYPTYSKDKVKHSPIRLKNYTTDDDRLILPLLNESGDTVNTEFDLSDNIKTIKGQVLWIQPEGCQYRLATRDEVLYENYPLILKGE